MSKSKISIILAFSVLLLGGGFYLGYFWKNEFYPISMRMLGFPEGLYSKIVSSNVVFVVKRNDTKSYYVDEIIYSLNDPKYKIGEAYTLRQSKGSNDDKIDSVVIFEYKNSRVEGVSVIDGIIPSLGNISKGDLIEEANRIKKRVSEAITTENKSSDR